MASGLNIRKADTTNLSSEERFSAHVSIQNIDSVGNMEDEDSDEVIERKLYDKDD